LATEPTRRLFTIHDYHRMVDAGILTEDDRVELLDGEIVQMTPIGSRHAGTVKRLTRVLVGGLGRDAVVGIQDPVILDDFSEPEPDVSVCVPRDDDYTSSHPRPDEILLLVEVADTSERYDRLRKLPRYAAVGVPETWLVDLTQNVIDVYGAPGPNGYEEHTTLGPGASLSPLRFPDVSIAVDDILPPA
jgi:Uma2 family endonuclease